LLTLLTVLTVAPLDLRSPYDVISEPIALVATERGRLILAKILMPANDLKELIAWLRANPRQGFAGKHRPRGFTHSGFSWPSGCGIEDIITRPDLADRAILLMLAPIAERQRRPETALWREFELARLRILGALLDAAAHGLQMLPQVRLEWLPRMADFAGATQSRTLSRPTQWRRVCVRLWPTERNGREALPIFCWPAPMLRATPWLGTALAGQRVRARRSRPASVAALKDRSILGSGAFYRRSGVHHQCRRQAAPSRRA
jgi:hypothetical protein